MAILRAPSNESDLNDVVVTLEGIWETLTEMRDLLKTIADQTAPPAPAEDGVSHPVRVFR